MSIIEVREVSFIYNRGTPFEKRAVDRVSFSVEEGEFIGIIGHTGSGKSTLIQHLNGLLFADEGEIFVDGEPVRSGKKLKGLRQKVGMVFQYPEHQLFEETCGEDVAFGPKNLGLSEEEIRDRVDEALSSVGLDPQEVRDRSPFELSGGQKRRVAIAGVLAMRPKIFVCDEPTAGLDPAGRDEIIREIEEIRRKRNLTVLYVTHSMEDIAALADRILVMDHGQLRFFDTPQEVFRHEEELEAMGLDVPQAVKLTSALARGGLDIPMALTAEEAARLLQERLP